MSTPTPRTTLARPDLERIRAEFLSRSGANASEILNAIDQLIATLDAPRHDSITCCEKERADRAERQVETLTAGLEQAKRDRDTYWEKSKEAGWYLTGAGEMGAAMSGTLDNPQTTLGQAAKQLTAELAQAKQTIRLARESILNLLPDQHKRLVERVAQLEDENAALRSQQAALVEWQPIETAPRTGRPVLLIWADVVRLARWHVADHELLGKFANWIPLDKGPVPGLHRPTHWMALPDPPTARLRDGAGA